MSRLKFREGSTAQASCYIIHVSVPNAMTARCYDFSFFHTQPKTYTCQHVYSVISLDKSNVSRWASRIAGSEKSQEELSDTPRCGWPTTPVTQKLLQRADELILNDWQITNRNIVTELSVFKRIVNNIGEALEYSNFYARWVPRRLSERQTIQAFT